jgi:predicted nucleic acid-binding protein
MRRYLLDTPFLAALLNNRPGAVSMATPWIAASEAATSVLVYAEVVEYIKPSQRYAQHYAALHNLLAGVYPYFLTLPILDRYADIRLALRRGQLIGDMDTLIAATALEHDLTIVTLDPDFQRVARSKDHAPHQITASLARIRPAPSASSGRWPPARLARLSYRFHALGMVRGGDGHA